MTEEVAAALATVQYRDANFQQRRLYTAWDNLKDEAMFFRGIDMLEAAGIAPGHVMAYMLIGYDKKETWELHPPPLRQDGGARRAAPFPMVFDPARADLKRFQRWAVHGFYRAFPFA